MFGKKSFIALLLLAWAPFVVRAVQVYLAANIPQAAAILKVTPGLFKDFLLQQDIFVFFITVRVGAGLIANDRRANALQIYLSKPLTRLEYIAGKLSILMAFVLLVTGRAGTGAARRAGAVCGQPDVLHEQPAPHSSDCAVLASSRRSPRRSAMLALSSLSKSARYVAVLYTAVIFLTQAIYGVLRRDYRRHHASRGFRSRATSPRLAGVLFRVPLEYHTPWPVSLAVIVGLIVLCGVILERRVRAVEVVA